MEKKVALITGSSHGIGTGIAKKLASEGYSVVVTYKEAADLANKVVQEIVSSSGEAICLQLDVTSEESVLQVFKTVKEKYGKLDVLVNNAAVDWATPIESCTFEDWKIITRTKIDGNFLCTKYALPLLKKPGKANIIVLMSSLGEKPDPDDPAYSVGTAGTICFVKVMALALAKYGIRTNGVGPGETIGSNLKYWRDNETEEMWRELARKNPLGRVTTPEDVGQVVKMIVNDPTEYLNGNFIYINGGGHLTR